MRKIIIFELFFLVILINQAAIATKLNYPRVLLPIFEKKSVNFTLEVIEKGCFKWTSSRQDLILIRPIYKDANNECSYQATVTVLTRERRRNTAIVLAEDLSTTEVLRCDVIVDVIDGLNVHTTTRQLYLEEAPETFELYAIDSQGNEFTTLEGIEFNWLISSPNRDSKHFAPALRFLTFTESAYHEVPPALENFEAQGIKGYMILLEGINTGASKVTVNMPHPEYSQVPSIEVFIKVLANIILEPSEVHIMRGDTIDFRILQLKMGKLHEISLNNQYFLELADTNVAQINGISVTGLRHGRTTVVLRDRNVPADGSLGIDENSDESSAPSAVLIVAEPIKLKLSLLPHNNWITVVEERHEIAIDLYTRDEQKITLGSRYSIQSEINESLFYILRRNKNGSRLYGEAMREGVTEVYGRFLELTEQVELQIFSKLLLHPSKVILPFDPNVIKSQKIQFQATGGDDSYIWQSANSRLININQQGLATTIIRDSDIKHSIDMYDAGSVVTSRTSVRVALSKNLKIFRQAEIYFLPPIRLEIKRYNFETALKDYVHLHIAVYTHVNGTDVPFNKCENLIFDFEFSNQIFQIDNSVSNETDLAPHTCQVVHLRSTAIGLTHLRVVYKFQDKILQDEVTLNVFDKLNILNPIENEIVLPIGASRNIIFSNGPQRIFTLEAELVKTNRFNKKVISISEIEFDTQNSIYAFTVLCREVGETTFNFEVHNVLTAPSFEAYKSQVSTIVYCVKPRFLNLYATQQLRNSCPLEMRSSLLHLKERNDKFDIDVEVQDVKNRKLMNISSLLIEWEFAAGDERYHTDSIVHRLQTEVEIYEGVRLPARDVLVTTLANVAPNFRIKGIVTKYNNKVLAKNAVRPEEPPFGIRNAKTEQIYTPVIENEIRFTAVNSTLFPFNHISVFMSRQRRERIPVAQGSGYYDIELSEQGIVKVDFEPKERQLLLTPLRIGNTRIELIDRCLMNEPAVLSVSVVSIGIIRVEGQDRVERAQSIEVFVKLYDSNDNLLNIDARYLEIYDLSETVFDDDKLSVKLGDQNNLNTGEIRYIINGNNIGETKIVFNSGNGAKLISSEPFNIQVFSPLRLYPRNSTLVPGSSIQIYHQGGPQPDINIIYEVHNKKVLTMESAIVTAKKLGETRITGKCISKNPRNGENEVISQDTIEMHVVPLLKTEVRTPLIRIRIGAVMPATVWGLPGLSPMVLGTLKNMHVTWSTNQPNVIEIFNIFSEAGIEYSANDSISVRIRGLNPGKASIQALVELPDGVKLNSSVEIVVFKMLELKTPKHIHTDWILAAPRSMIQLKCNLDDVLYKLDADSSGIVSVSSDGVVRTRDTLGRDLIIAKTVEQSLPIGVEVKNIQYLLISLVHPTAKLKQTEHKIPRGINFILKVSLHDNLGNEFSHNIDDINGLKYELSHKDIVDVQLGNNLTVAINLPRETNNMIAISLKDSTGVKHIEDYVKLSVADSKQVYPVNTIFSVGDIICFESALSKSVWSSSNEQTLSINRLTGVAKVLDNSYKIGEKIFVTNGDKESGSYIKYDVEVRYADVIHLLKSFDIFSGTEYYGHLVLRNHLQTNKLTNLITQNITKCTNSLDQTSVDLYKCRLSSKQALGIQLLKHYKVTPVFDVASGRYACHIDLLADFNDVLKIVKTKEVHFELEAALPNGLTDTLSLKFLPGVKVSPETLLATEGVEQDLTITGLNKVLDKVQVHSSDEEYVQVDVGAKVQGLLHYKIRIKKEIPTDEQLYVHVISPGTQQDVEIPFVGTTLLVKKCAQYPFSNSSELFYHLATNVGLIITGMIILAAGMWAYVCTSPNRKVIINSKVFENPQSPSNENRSLNQSPSQNQIDMNDDTSLDHHVTSFSRNSFNVSQYDDNRSQINSSSFNERDSFHYNGDSPILTRRDVPHKWL